MTQVLAVIAARGGSKGVPGKNIRPLAGKPLITYTIDAAIDARSLDRTIVSTDSPEIADVAQGAHAEVPFMRPPELGGDSVTIYPVLVHALEWLDRNEGYRPEYLVLLQPTSPLRLSQDIDDAVSIAQVRHADGVVSVCEADPHPFLTKRLADDGHLIDLFSDGSAGRLRQDLPPVYALNGAVYLARAQLLLERSTFYTEKTFPLIMPVERSLDIDTEADFQYAEWILGTKQRWQPSSLPREPS